MTSKRQATHTFIFVALSIVLSAILHLGALVWLSSVTFEFVKLKGAATKQKRRFALQEVKETVQRRVRETSGAGGGRGGEAGSEIGEFRRDYDPGLIDPVDAGDGNVSGAEAALLKHSQREDEGSWQPRRELLDISEKLIGKDVVRENRRIIPEIARGGDAPDIVYPVDYEELGRASAPAPIGGGRQIENGEQVLPLAPPAREDAPVRGPSPETGGISEALDEAEKGERRIRSIDDFLRAELTVYTPFFSSENAYFKLEVRRKGEDVLPVLPKDIVFVQDSSASMAEQRLHFCRKGIAASLRLVSEEDRFNIVSFSDKPVFCFEDWVRPSGGSLEKGKRYASNLRSAGNTDILASMGALRDLKVEKGRPCVAFLVTDGLATTGIVESAAIIREFTKANEHGVSVYTMGTRSDANMFLLDILSYCNGGATHVVKGGRWSIAEDFTNQVQAISRPVLSNLKLAFAGNGVEVYPAKVRHLYLDDPLVIYGRLPKSMARVTFQAMGAAGDTKCDMIFDLSVEDDARKGAKDVRQEWAMQKAYHLVGEIARTGDEAYRGALLKLARDYGLKIPYADKL